MPNMRHAFRLTAAVWLVGVVIYLLAEYLAARAFSPAYSVAHNFISDLGVPECGDVFQGRSICSPRHDLINAAFSILGLSTFVGAVLFRRATGTRQYRGFAVAAALFGAGMNCIAIFHGGNASEADGSFILHVLGALVAIFSGIAAIVLSPTWRFIRTILTACSVTAFATLASAQLLSFTIIVGDGIWERAILYPILAWQGFAAFELLVLARASSGNQRRTLGRVF